MIFKYLKISFREIKKNKFLTLINILGLALGLAVSLLLFLFINSQLGYDTYNINAKRIYKINNIITSDNQHNKTGICRSASKDAILTEVPGVEKIAKVYLEGYGNIYVGDKRYNSQKIILVDPEFTDIFTFTTIYGNLETALDDAGGIIINRNTSEKFFGDENPVGKTLRYDKTVFTVKAVIEDIPKKSHYSFDIVGSIHTFPSFADFGGMEFVTYIMLKEGVNHHEVLSKCREVNDRINNDLFAQWGAICTSETQKLTDVYLRSDYSTRLGAQGSIESVYIFSIIAFFVLLTAIINYINLFTAHYKSRIKDYTIHKVMGAERRDLFVKLTTTSGLLTLISAIIALVIVQLLIPEASMLLRKRFELNLISLPGLWFLFITIITAILSGLYPAFAISRQPIQNTIKGHQVVKGRFGFSGSLVIFQFVVSVVAITTALGIVKQIDFLKSYDLGYSPENVIVVQDLNKEILSNIDGIRDELKASPMIEMVTSSVHDPVGGTSGQAGFLKAKGKSEEVMINEKRVHAGYFHAMGIQLVEGREFSEEIETDKTAMILNQAAVKALGGGENIIGQKLIMWEKEFTIIGIAADHHYYSLRSAIEPLMFTNYRKRPNFIVIKTVGLASKSTLDIVNSAFKKVDDSWQSASYIMKDMNLRNYQQEDRIKTMVLIGGGISIVLSLLGLFALSLFMLRKRSKEIGIRKVNGATVMEIIFMLNKVYLRWMAIAFIIAFPLAFYLIELMLENYAYKTTISWWIFALAGVAVLIISLATVWLQTYRTAKQNPVEVLKYE